MNDWRIEHGDCRELLANVPSGSVQCCVTSPPYFGLRDYKVDGQIGLEPTPEEYVAQLVAVFREVHRVLRDDGLLFLNLGDSYAGSGRGGNPDDSPQPASVGRSTYTRGSLGPTRTARGNVRARCTGV